MLSNELEKIASQVKATLKEDDPELNNLFNATYKEGGIQAALDYGIEINKIKNKEIKKAVFDVQKAIKIYNKLEKKIQKATNWEY